MFHAAARRTPRETSRFTKWLGRPRAVVYQYHVSCLCTRSDGYSFRPRWRPPFVSHLVRKTGPPERPGTGRGPGALRHRPGRNEHGSRVAGNKTTAACSWTSPRTESSPAACPCPTRPVGRWQAMVVGVRGGHDRHRRSGLGRVSADCRVARLHPGLVIPWAAGLCGSVAGSRVGHFSGIPLVERLRERTAACGW